ALEVQGHQLLAAVLYGENGVFVVLADHALELPGTPQVVAYEVLDLYDLGAVGAEHPAGCRRRDNCRQLHDLYAFKGQHLISVHGSCSLSLVWTSAGALRPPGLQLSAERCCGG